jgi:hypothetical protein
MLYMKYPKKKKNKRLFRPALSLVSRVFRVFPCYRVNNAVIRENADAYAIKRLAAAHMTGSFDGLPKPRE